MYQNIINETLPQQIFTYGVSSPVIDASRCQELNFVVAATVSTPANKTFASTAVDTTADTITITAHGYATGLAVTFTTAGSLPTGLSTSTTYYLIVVDVNTIQVATTLDNAKAGTAIDLTTQGSGNSTVNVTSISGASVTLQGSNDGITYVDVGSAVDITQTGALDIPGDDPLRYRFYQLVYAITAGEVTANATVLGKGLV